MLNKAYDVIVSGGGLSGIAAAVSAAREGLNVLIIEQYGFLGGMATAGLVNPFMPYSLRKEDGDHDISKKVNLGIFKKILDDLDNIGGLHKNQLTFNEELLKLVLDRIIKKYAVHVLFHSIVSGVKRQESKITSVIVTNKSGISEYNADFFIDSTGDADLCKLAGCKYKVGRDEDGYCQPMTLCFRIGNIDNKGFNNKWDTAGINKKYKELKEKGLIKNPREDVLIFLHMVDSVLHFNSTRIIKKSALNAEDLSAAEIEARQQVFELYCFLKENIQGFENCQLLMTAPQIGVRESRRITGEYILTQNDLLEAKKFDDSIARGTYPIDIHNPSGSGTIIKAIPFGDYYTIPYKALIPKGLDNLIVAGRAISSTHEAHSAYRIMPICTCIGEGAGTATAIAFKNSIPYKEVNAEEIHSLLTKYGALY
jgi:hypothetical protein